MKAIGFTTEFFTLWEVTEENIYTSVNGQNRLAYTQVYYSYFQNLSKIESKAKEKFTKLTGELAPEVDKELYGKKTSFSFKKNNQDVYLDSEFNKGKYCGKIINECDDYEYLFWSYNEKIFNEIRNSAIKNILLKNGYGLNLNKELMLLDKIENCNKGIQKELDAITEWENIKKSGMGRLLITPKYNIDSNGCYYEGNIVIIFDNVIKREYNGYEYYLPTIKGKGKLIKNRNVIIEVIAEDCELFERKYTVINIKSINKK